ncbi:LuxR C-terminal-related transcriptional regulator (plasmid) [Robbsia andropogonis]|uniref:LuxR C-terminal-related transcriptional regulator n=1 Tax=Robbsia andropogonis TaxID=28092 RepID=UPI003D1E4119
MKKITLGLADGHPIAMFGLSQVLADQLDFEIVFSCPQISDLLRCLVDTSVDVLLCNFEFPGDSQADGVPLLKAIRRIAPHTKILILSSCCSSYLASVALSAGASGFVGKSHRDCASLPRAVREVHDGNIYLPASLASAVLCGFFQKSDPSSGPNALSEKEGIVAHMHSNGLTISEIAARLHCSQETVSKHKNAAMRKLGARNNVELARIMRDLAMLSR